MIDGYDPSQTLDIYLLGRDDEEMMHSTRWVFDSVTLLCLMSTLGVPCWAGALQIIRPPQNKTVMENRRFRFPCKVSGDGHPVVKWYHNGTEMPRKRNNYKINSEGLLRFTEVKVSNRGMYQCKVENDFKESIQSEPVYLYVQAQAVILDKEMVSRDRLVAVNSVHYVSCEGAGIPTPRIEWRKNGELLRPSDKTKLYEKVKEVSLVSRLKLTVTESAIYTCSAINLPIDGLANDSVTINVTAVPDRAASKEPSSLYCAPYNGTICGAYLRGRMVVHNNTVGYDTEVTLENHLLEMSAMGLFSGPMGEGFCEDPARRLLCHVAYPDCQNETSQPVPICRESCLAVESLFCFRQFAELEDIEGDVLRNKGLLSLPKCLSLPSKWNTSQSCVESDHHEFAPYKVRDECYIEKGRWYNGTVNVTKSGHTCQAWADKHPQQHRRSPLIFPELKGAENYCRNPGGEEDRPWCYTTNKRVRWEICEIEPCDTEEPGLDSSREAEREMNQQNEDDLSLLYIIGASTLVAVCILIAILCFLLHYCRHMRYNATPQDDLEIDVENLPVNSAYHQMKSNRLNPKLETLEFPRNDIVFIQDIGQGAFGRVFKARIVCSNGNSHITGGKLSGSKHSLSCGKNCKHNRNPFSSKGDLRHFEVHGCSKSSDSRLLAEHIAMSCDHDKDDIKYCEGQLIAIKMLKEDASESIQSDFEREASLMVEFDHPNIVRLLGVCTIGKPMCLLFEYMSKGDLNEFLRLCSPDQCLRRNDGSSTRSIDDVSSVDIVDQLYMAKQIANGMVYLSDRGYVHRDLATRNCLVGNNLIVKISDFGLARSVHSMDYYHGSDKDAIPIRWMPPEAILYNKFSSQSDVWSFGILLWEIFSFALQPYYGMTHEEVVNYLRGGHIMDSPDNTPAVAYDLMKSCWHRKPPSRPSFVSLHKSLSVMYEEMNKQKTRNAVNV